MQRRLLALDMDGTLLRNDGEVDPRDRAAIARAAAAGVTVTIATGRLATGALPTARSLGLSAPLVCADGAVTVCGRTGERLEQQGLALHAATAMVGTFDAHALTPFVLTHDVVHCDEAGRAHAPWVSIWTAELQFHARLGEATAWKREGEVALMVGIGPRGAVEAAVAKIENDHAEHVETAMFRVALSDEWTGLARPRGCSKGAALSRLAARLGVARENVAAVGDWHNDVSMFQWAGRSFAMGQAPEAVRDVATDQLRATAATGGGVAEAIERWLAAPASTTKSVG